MIELLVVVAIITVLIAILLPSLTAARRRARTAACGANLHGITQVAATYAAEYEDYILGGVTTTGQSLVDFSNTPLSGITSNNCPTLIRTDDWMTPVLMMQNKIDGASLGGSAASRGARFVTAVNEKLFTCPANETTADLSGSDPANAFVPAQAKMMSYNTAALFYLYPANTKLNGVAGLNLVTTGSTVNAAGTSGTFDPGASYAPRFRQVGAPSRKVFMADAARYTIGGLSGITNAVAGTMSKPTPTWSMDIKGGNSNVWTVQYSGFAPCFVDEFSWNRNYAKNNYNTAPFSGSAPQYDARIWWARHGSGGAAGSVGDFKFNLAFFDGHVELMTDLEGSNPNLWMPSGSRLNVNSGMKLQFQLQPDAKAAYVPVGAKTLAAD